MRVIYLVRGAQLLLTLRALWLLYSVSHFCEKTQHSFQSCSAIQQQEDAKQEGYRIRPATPEEIAELLQRRAASKGVMSNASTTTAPSKAIIENSTVSTTDAAKNRKKRVKREEKFVLPGNGIIDPERKAAAAVEMKKDKEEKEGEQKSTHEVKTDATTEAKAEEKKEVTTPAPTPHVETTIAQKSEHSEVKESKVEVKKKDKKEGEQKPTPGVKTEAKTDEKKGQTEDKNHPSVEKKEEKTVKKKEESVHSTIEASKEPKKEKKEHLGAKVDIPVASNAHHDKKPAEGKIDPAPSSSSSSEEKHHTVKKDLKAHVQEPVKIEDEKKELPTLPTVRESNDADGGFLEHTRCVEVTWSAFAGRQSSPFAAHLKGLVFVGPVLVAVCVYLVCTVLLTTLTTEAPSKFAEVLGCTLHAALWVVVMQSLAVIWEHWALTWYQTSDAAFKPDFPAEWTALMILSGIMLVAVGVETIFQATSKRLQYDIVFERAYRCYEVIDTDPSQGRLSRTNVY